MKSGYIRQRCNRYIGNSFVEIRREMNRISIQNFGYSVFNKSRLRDEILYHRQTIMYIFFDLYGCTLENVVEICQNGHRYDHATVHHSVKVVRNELKTYENRRENLRYWNDIVNKVMKTYQDNDEVLQFLNKLQSTETLSENDKSIINKIKKQLGYD